MVQGCKFHDATHIMWHAACTGRQGHGPLLERWHSSKAQISSGPMMQHFGCLRQAKPLDFTPAEHSALSVHHADSTTPNGFGRGWIELVAQLSTSRQASLTSLVDAPVHKPKAEIAYCGHDL